MSSREKLRFSEQVKSNFEFLTNIFGFSLIEENFTYVRYESNNIFINIYHGRLSYELDIEFEVKSSNEKFYIDNIITYTNLGNPIDRIHVATKEDVVKKGVKQLSDLVKNHAVLLLKSDKNFINDLWNDNLRLKREFAISEKLRYIKKEATTAWNEKNYSKLIELYESIKDHLTDVERKKFDFAKKIRSVNE